MLIPQWLQVAASPCDLLLAKAAEMYNTGRTELQSLGKSLLFRGECLMASENPEPEQKRLIQKRQSRKPYRKPAFRLEKVFETQALSCGKIIPTTGSCHSNRKNS